MIKSKSKSNLLLFLTVAVIWGIIGTKVYYYFSAGNDNESIETTGIDFDESIDRNEMKLAPSEADVSYVDLERDPFLLKNKRVVKKKKTEVPVVQPKIENDIDFVINGVILKENRKLVILQDITNNSTMFLREGEKYKNLKINFISPTAVSLLQNNKERKIFIE